MKVISYSGLTLLLTARAWSTVILSGEVNLTITTSLDGIYLDLVSGTLSGVDESFSSSQVNFFFGGDGIFSGERFLPARIGTGNLDRIISVEEGMTISDALSFAAPGTGGSSGHIGAGIDQFAIGQPEYIAFKFDPLDDGNFTFGWMRVTLTNGSSPGIIHEWAYSDTPGELIEVGGGTVVPEPTTTLSILASLGLVFLRRRN